MSGKEIISVQCGNFSNFIGSHWWNFHESNCYSSFATKGIFNYDILFNQGENMKREVTYTPRLMIIDAKGSLGYLSQFGQQLYNGHDVYDTTGCGGVFEGITSSTDNAACWDGKIEIVDQSEGGSLKRGKNDFLRALESEFEEVGTANGEMTRKNENGFERINDSCVVGSSQSADACMEVEEAAAVSFREQVFHLNNQIYTWSDYMKTLLHPRTITIINEYEMKVDDQEARIDFGSFSAGSEFFKNHLDGLESNCFYLVEKCDNMQGFNVLSDAYDGVLAAVSSEFLFFLNDEFPKKPILSFPCCEPLSNKQVQKCYGELGLNSVMALSSSLNSAQTVTPLSLANDWLSWQRRPSWMTMPPHSDWFTTACDYSNKYEQSALLALVHHSCLAPLYCAEDHFMPLYSFAQLMTPCQRKVLSMSSNFGRFSSLSNCSQPPSNDVSPLFGCCSPSMMSSAGRSTNRPLASMTCLWNSNNTINSQRLPSCTREQIWRDCLLRQPFSNCSFDLGEGVLLEAPFPKLFSKSASNSAKMNVSMLSAVSNCDVSSVSLLLQKVCPDSSRNSADRMNRRLASACSRMNMDQDSVCEAIETLHTQLGQYIE